LHARAFPSERNSARRDGDAPVAQLDRALPSEGPCPLLKSQRAGPLKLPSLSGKYLILFAKSLHLVAHHSF
jgi:hypothetical protein